MEFLIFDEYEDGFVLVTCKDRLEEQFDPHCLNVYLLYEEFNSTVNISIINSASDN